MDREGGELASLPEFLPETLQAEWQERDRENAFWREHWSEFASSYPGELVAVRHGDVVAHAPTLGRLLFLVESQGLDPAQLWIRLIDLSPRQLIL